MFRTFGDWTDRENIILTWALACKKSMFCVKGRNLFKNENTSKNNSLQIRFNIMKIPCKNGALICFFGLMLLTTIGSIHAADSDYPWKGVGGAQPGLYEGINSSPLHTGTVDFSVSPEAVKMALYCINALGGQASGKVYTVRVGAEQSLPEEIMLGVGAMLDTRDMINWRYPKILNVTIVFESSVTQAWKPKEALFRGERNTVYYGAGVGLE
jgi:hypothetical protein